MRTMVGGKIDNIQVMLIAVLKASADDIIKVLARMEKNKSGKIRKRKLNEIDIDKLDEANDFLFKGDRLQSFRDLAGLTLSVTFLRKYLKNYIERCIENSKNGKRSIYVARSWLKSHAEVEVDHEFRH